MQKYSRQREALVTLLKSVTNHPSAEWLYSNLKKEFPNIGIATVYRNLNMLTQSGEILKIDVGSGKEHYDGNAQNHYHMYCYECEGIYDIDMEYNSEIDVSAAKVAGADIARHSLVFYGICSKCKNKNNIKN